MSIFFIIFALPLYIAIKYFGLWNKAINQIAFLISNTKSSKFCLPKTKIKNPPFFRSDTESAEDNTAPVAPSDSPRNEAGEPVPSEDTTDAKEESAKRGPTVGDRFSNFFAVVKKSVASKGSNTKEKYATPEGEAEAKVINSQLYLKGAR